MTDGAGSIQRVKKQHYVPQFYLRRFTNDGSHLFACDKFEGRSYGTRVEDAASANYFNDAPLDADTSSPGDRDLRQTLEHRLNDSETSAASALDSIIRGVEQNKAIDPSVRPGIARFVALQVLRTQEARVLSAQLWDRGLSTLRHERLAPRLQAWLARADRPDGAAITQSHLLLNDSIIQMIAEALLEHIWFIGLNATATPLWISDHPVVRKAHMDDPFVGTWGLASPGIEIDLPLTPKMVLVLADRSYHASIAPIDGKTTALIPDTIRYLNAQQAVQCYKYVYGPTNDFSLLRQMRQERPELFRPDRSRVEVVSPSPDSDAPFKRVSTRLSRAVRKLLPWPPSG